MCVGRSSRLREMFWGILWGRGGERRVSRLKADPRDCRPPLGAFSGSRLKKMGLVVQAVCQEDSRLGKSGKRTPRLRGEAPHTR